MKSLCCLLFLYASVIFSCQGGYLTSPSVYVDNLYDENESLDIIESLNKLLSSLEEKASYALFLNQEVLEIGGGGSGVGNGGHLIQCDGKELMTLDYFETLLLSLHSDIKIHDSHSMRRPLDVFAEQVKLFPSFYREFMKTYRLFSDPSLWIPGALSTNTGDARLAYKISESLCNNGQVHQAIIRQGFTIFFDPVLLNQLSVFQKEILMIHEILYYLGEKYGHHENSSKVRQVLRVFLTKLQYKTVSDFYQLSMEQRLASALQELMGEDFVIKYDPFGIPNNLLRREKRVSSVDMRLISEEMDYPIECFGNILNKGFKNALFITFTRDEDEQLVAVVSFPRISFRERVNLVKQVDPQYMNMSLVGNYHQYRIALSHTSTRQVLFRIDINSFYTGPRVKQLFDSDVIGLCY